MASIPGPRRLPVIGNLHQLGSIPHESLTDLWRRYGAVYRILLGSRPVVVLNGSRAIEQALISQAKDFAGRPEDLPIFRTIARARGNSIVYNTYGEEWKLRRELAIKAIVTFTDGENKGILEKHISEEVLKMIEFISTKQERPIFDSVLTSHSTLNIFTRFVFGEHSDLEDSFLEEMRRNSDEFLDHLGKSAVVNAFPSLDRWIPSRLRGLEGVVLRQKELLEPVVKRCNDSYVEGSERNVLHYIKTHGAAASVDNELLVYDVIGAGHGGVHATLNWALVYALAFPDLQREIQDEIDRVVGRERTPTFSDRESLPLTDAFIAEVGRHAAVIPVTPPRMTTKDTVLQGDSDYAIPEGTMIFCNLYSLFYDPEKWEKPGDFSPKRFLSEDGKSLDMDKVDSVRRFGGGMRMCVGSKIATQQLFLFFAIVMHQCSLKNGSAEEITLKGTPMPGSIGIHAPAAKIEIVRR